MKRYGFFATLLDYPDSGFPQVLKDSFAEGCVANPEADALLRKFKTGCERLGLERLEELYTNTFDLRPDCSLYAGHHLFGEDWRRSFFLSELQGRYQTRGFSAGTELPDHVAVLLRFLALEDDPDERTVLVGDCLIPAVSAMAARLDPATNPYRPALEALLICLKEDTGVKAVGHSAGQPEEATKRAGGPRPGCAGCPAGQPGKASR